MGANQSSTTTTTTTPPPPSVTTTAMGSMGFTTSATTGTTTSTTTTTTTTTNEGNTTSSSSHGNGSGTTKGRGEKPYTIPPPNYEDPFDMETYHIRQHLPPYHAIHRNFPGSGRLMRTYTIQHGINGSLAVVKTTWIQSKHPPPQQQQQQRNTNSSGTSGQLPPLLQDSHSHSSTTTTTTTTTTTATSSIGTGGGSGPSSSSTTTPSTTTTTTTTHPKKTVDLLLDEIMELKRIQQAVGHYPHIAPYHYWKSKFMDDLVNGTGTGTGMDTTIPLTPLYLVRSHVYTTLSDRCASRPFLHHVEKLWITYQLLQTLEYMHQRQVVHGMLTTENVGLTSWNFVMLLDIASYKACTNLPNDDPSDYLYYFQEQQQQQQQHDTMMGGGTRRGGGLSLNNNTNSSSSGGGGESKEKRCYLAPERFRPFTTPSGKTTSSSSSSSKTPTPTTTTTTTTSTSSTMTTTTTQRHPAFLQPSSDLFSLGCVLMEMFLNGERSLDLGDLMEYRQAQNFTPRLHHKLNKIESSAIRAACRHMLHLQPTERLTPQEYLDRLIGESSSSSSSKATTIESSSPLQEEESSSSSQSSQSSSQSSPQQPSSSSPSPPAMPSTFQTIFDPLFISVTQDVITPDARMAICGASYSKIVQATVGVHDVEGEAYFAQVLGSTSSTSSTSTSSTSSSMNKTTKMDDNDNDTDIDPTTVPKQEEKKQDEEEEKEDTEHSTNRHGSSRGSSANHEYDNLVAETQALLEKLETWNVEDCDMEETSIWPSWMTPPNTSPPTTTKKKTKNPDETTDTSSTNDTHQKKKKSTQGSKRSSVSPMTTTTPLSASTTPSSLLLFLQLILSTIRHVQRPSSKLVGLQLLERLGTYSSDDARLQRIVPTTIVLLQDQDPLVRAHAIQVLTSTLTRIDTFPPSDSKVFPQYILKRVTHFITDPSLVVRVAFAECIPRLAETSHRFLDISHAVRLYEAVGGGGGVGGSHGTSGNSGGVGSTSNSGPRRDTATMNEGSQHHPSVTNVFGDDVTKLLDGNNNNTQPTTATGATTTTAAIPSSSSLDKKNPTSDTPSEGMLSKGKKHTMPASVGRTLINSTYDAELASLRETVSRWVIHITTDQSEQSSPPKLGLLRDLARLCNFFGRDGAISFILPQILTFLNDRKDWQLRAGLFEHLPSLCYIIGRAATEHFVFPLLEIALVDGEEQVMSRALYCLASLVEMGLLSRAVLVGTPLHSLSSVLDESKGRQPFRSGGMFEKYAPLLLYPSTDVRLGAIALTNAAARKFGFPDRDVFLVPLLRPYLRFEPSAHHLTTPEGLTKCLVAPWTRAMLQAELEHLSLQQNFSPTAGKWTSIGIDVKEGDGGISGDAKSAERVRDGGITQNPSSTANNADQQSSRLHLFSQDKNSMESHVDQVLGYLRMLARSRKRLLDYRSDHFTSHRQLANAIEGSLKLAQHIKFPNQKYVELIASPIPAWYTELREMSLNDKNCCSESTAIRSVASLSKVYGLSLMHATVDDPKAPIVDTPDVKEIDMIGDDVQMTTDENKAMLTAEESKSIERACVGEWGSEASLDPSNVDTSLLVAKLKGLNVPPLPPELGALRVRADQSLAQLRSPASHTQSERPLEMEWRPKSDALVASSIPTTGHSAPVSRLAVAKDQSFFVSGSHDGTCRVWELRQAENSNGVLKSSLTYSGHSQEDGRLYPRINDVAIVENSNSVVSGASDGSVHIWRVGVVSTSKQSIESPTSTNLGNFDRSRVSGSSVVRNIDSKEGEILAVSHFNSPSASVVTFATQKGSVHSWDLRCAREPFLLKHRPDLGYLTSMALGNDRHWMITGTNRGFLSLWDIRFQKTVKLWQHSSAAPVNRLGAWFGCLPRGHTVSSNDTRPYMFAACGPNECSMFDIVDSSCRQCFRVLDPSTGYMDPSAMTLPTLQDIPIATSFGRQNQNKRYWNDTFAYNSESTTSLKPQIAGMVGSINGKDPRDYLITGGSDCVIRYFDFVSPTKCYTVSGGQQRPSFERVDFEGQGRLITCRDNPALRLRETESAHHPQRLHQGISRADTKHHDAITDIKMVKHPMRALLSCSNDGAIKIFR